MVIDGHLQWRAVERHHLVLKLGRWAPGSAGSLSIDSTGE